MNLLILGTGKVATIFARKFNTSEDVAVRMWGRSLDKLVHLSEHYQIEFEPNFDNASVWADFIIVAVSDNAIASIAQKLSGYDKPVIHLSGNTSLEVLKAKNIMHCGVCWPVISFGSIDEWSTDVPMVIEATDSETLNQIKKVFNLLPVKFYELPLEHRRILHIAAVASNNFVHHLFNIASQLLKDHNIPEEIIQSLIKTTVSNLDWSKLNETQTGPAVRGDHKTIEAHLQILSKNPEWAKLYETLSQSIAKHHNS